MLMLAVVRSTTTSSGEAEVMCQSAERRQGHLVSFMAQGHQTRERLASRIILAAFSAHLFSEINSLYLIFFCDSCEKFYRGKCCNAIVYRGFDNPS